MIPDTVFIPYEPLFPAASVYSNWTPKQSDYVLSSDVASCGSIAIAEQVITDRYGDISIYRRNMQERNEDR